MKPRGNGGLQAEISVSGAISAGLSLVGAELDL